MTRLSHTLFAAIIVALGAVGFTSCNKDSNTHSSTKVKCVTCANGGQCINDSCQCPAGYEGISCQTLSIQKFEGSWMVSEKGSISTVNRQYQIEIQSVFGVSNGLQLGGFYDYFSSVNATASGDTIYIPSQITFGKMVVGKGFIHPDPNFGINGGITMRYMVKDTSTGQIDDYGYNSPSTTPSAWIR